jgi:hypothetical protein
MIGRGEMAMSSRILDTLAMAAVAGLFGAQARAQEATSPSPWRAREPGVAPPAPTGVDALAAFRRQMIEIRPTTSGFSTVRLQRRDGLADLGYFGGGADDIFAGSPEALAAMDRFRSARTTGTVLWVTGLGAATAGIVLMFNAAARTDSYESDDSGVSPPVYLGAILGGLALEIAGVLIAQGAYDHLGAAVDAYNNDLGRRLSHDAGP